jgi:hypothetical protein
VGAFLSVGDPKANKPIPPGFRVHGKYTGEDGFDIEFYPENVLIGCRDAIIARNYSVSMSGNRVLVNIQHGATPIMLELQPDGTLAGSGQVQVSSRRVVAVKQRIEGTRNVQEPVFEPVTDTCALGVLVPPEGPRAGAATSAVATRPAGATTSAGADAPARTADAPTPPRTSGNVPATSSNATPAPAGMGTLSVTGALGSDAGGNSPLTGGLFLLTKESLESVLRKGGVRPSPGGTATKVWANACESRQPLCQQALSGLQAVLVGPIAFDARGKAQTPSLPSGTYYLLGSITYNNRLWVWDLRVDLKPGANSVTVNEGNAVPRN